MPPPKEVPPRRPTLEEFRAALEAVRVAQANQSAAERLLSNLHGNLLDCCRWEMIRAAAAWSASANAQTDHDMRDAAQKLTDMWRTWDMRYRNTGASVVEVDALIEAFETLYQVKR